MVRKVANALMALTMATGMTLQSAPKAEAHGHGGVGLGIAAGIIGLGILGAAVVPRVLRPALLFALR